MQQSPVRLVGSVLLTDYIHIMNVLRLSAANLDVRIISAQFSELWLPVNTLTADRRIYGRDTLKLRRCRLLWTAQVFWDVSATVTWIFPLACRRQWCSCCHVLFPRVEKKLWHIWNYKIGHSYVKMLKYSHVKTHITRVVFCFHACRFSFIVLRNENEPVACEVPSSS